MAKKPGPKPKVTVAVDNDPTQGVRISDCQFNMGSFDHEFQKTAYEVAKGLRIMAELLQGATAGSAITITGPMTERD